MARESIDAKASRYLGEGRIHILLVEVDKIRAIVRGSDGRRYRVRYDRGAFHEWRCECSVFLQMCSHVRAVQRVTAGRRSQVKVSAGNSQPGGVGVAT